VSKFTIDLYFCVGYFQPFLSVWCLCLYIFSAWDVSSLHLSLQKRVGSEFVM